MREWFDQVRRAPVGKHKSQLLAAALRNAARASQGGGQVHQHMPNVPPQSKPGERGLKAQGGGGSGGGDGGGDLASMAVDGAGGAGAFGGGPRPLVALAAAKPGAHLKLPDFEQVSQPLPCWCCAAVSAAVSAATGHRS